jgi:hypothetical protein
MKPRTAIVLTCVTALLVPACDSKKSGDAPAPVTQDEAARNQDKPILPVSRGDSWLYDVQLEIPADVTSAGAAEVRTKYRRTRKYLGKLAAADGLPETDCFEVVVTGSPDEREFVEIRDDRILTRGSLIMRPETTKPLWLDPPVPFVIAGMKAGDALPELMTADGSLSRKTSVVAREDITVPAGTFSCIRLLTTGRDGDIDLKRTIWFAPGKGIIREEKSRMREGKPIFREIHELVEMTKAS